MTEFLSGLPQVFTSLQTIMLNPTSNLTVAFLLYGTIGLVLLVVLVGAILALLGPDEATARPAAADGSAPSDEAFEQLEVGETYEGVEGAGEAAAPGGKPAKVKVPVPPLSPRTRIAVAAVAAVIVALAWAVTGYTTSDPAVCKECHWAASQHATAPAGTDPHAGVSCVACHEHGGVVGRFTTDVPARLMHFADTQSGTAPMDEYGRVTAAACTGCHAAALAGVQVDETRGLKVSHREPMAASATCTDCHALRSGVVSAHNAGMTPCLRCHDAKRASAECGTCHDQNAGSAARARTVSFAAVQIPEVSCGGCHNEKRDCDWCHGLRLPHTVEFMQYAHARAGAVDFWYNGGKTCSRCHTATRRPCQQCHGGMLGKGHGTGKPWLPRGHQKASAAACDTCHAQFARQARRDFCRDVCHTPAAIAASPR